MALDFLKKEHLEKNIYPKLEAWGWERTDMLIGGAYWSKPPDKTLHPTVSAVGLQVIENLAKGK